MFFEVKFKENGRSSNGGKIGCGCFIAVLLINIIAGAWSVNFLLTTFGKTAIAYVWAALIGLIAGEITIPVAVIVKILKLCGAF